MSRYGLMLMVLFNNINARAFVTTSSNILSVHEMDDLVPLALTSFVKAGDAARPGAAAARYNVAKFSFDVDWLSVENTCNNEAIDAIFKSINEIRNRLSYASIAIRSDDFSSGDSAHISNFILKKIQESGMIIEILW